MWMRLQCVDPVILVYTSICCVESAIVVIKPDGPVMENPALCTFGNLYNSVQFEGSLSNVESCYATENFL